MKIWVDDIREYPDYTWWWVKDSWHAIQALNHCMLNGITVERLSLDHDLGGDDTTRPVILWLCNHNVWPDEVVVHSANPTGIEWLESMINRYHPVNVDKHQMVPPNLNRQYTCVECGDPWPCRIGSQNEESDGSEGGYSRGAETMDEVSEDIINRYRL